MKTSPQCIRPKTAFVTLLTVMLTCQMVYAETPCDRVLPAFPGAEGFGAETLGGRGGRVIEVSNLNDSGPGSFRVACMAAGPRIVVFRVGGTIELKRRIAITKKNSFLTIAGQTAPGGGVQTKGFDLFLEGGVHDVVIRNMRFRPGHTKPNEWGKHALQVYGPTPQEKCYNIVIDHCSLYWGPDETAAAWDYVENVTWQWCITEGMEHRFPNTRYENSKAYLFGSSSGGAVKNITVHHCYMVNCAQRNPAIADDGPFQVINNVIYNWRAFGTGINRHGEGAKVNLIGNYYKRGPDSSTTRYAVAVDVVGNQKRNPDGYIFVRDNIGPFRPSSKHDEWAIVGSGYDRSKYWTAPARRSLQRMKPWPDSPIPVTIDSSDKVATLVLADVGAIAPRRDALDERAVNNFYKGTGSIKTAKDQQDSDWPVLAAGKPPKDTDHDGMPDRWETEHGLDPTNPADRNGTNLSKIGYTNVEVYINGLLVK